MIVESSDPDLVRMFSHVLVVGECWEWTLYRDRDGYGGVKFHGKTKKVHRVSFAALVGEIPDGFTIDHRCRNRACVRPDHLRAVTNPDNVKAGGNSIKTHCDSGHEFTPENTRERKDRPGRACRACDATRSKRYRRHKGGH